MSQEPLSKLQLDALIACADNDRLLRTRDGYSGTGRAPFYNSRTVFELHRRKLLKRVAGRGDSEFRPTSAGWRVATQAAADRGDFHVKQMPGEGAATL